MSGITGKNTSTAFRKKDVAESRLTSIGFKKLRFMHKATEGQTLIQLASLTTPTEATANGFIQPSPSDLAKTDLYLFKENVELESSIRGKLTQFLAYVINGPSTIKLLFDAEENEIITGIIDLSARTGSTLVDAEPLVSTGSLLAGETDFNVGTPFKVGMFPNAQHGAVMVYLDNQLVYRNSGNNPPGPGVDGEYQEIHAGGGLGVLIRFNSPDLVNDRNVTVVSIGSLVERPNGSLVALVEALQGQIDSIVPTVAELAGVDETDFQATPNQVDLKAFGDRVLTAEQLLILLKTVTVPITTPWAAFTPVFTNGPTFTVFEQFRWMRMGSKLLIEGSLLATGTGGAGILELLLPAALSGESFSIADVYSAGFGTTFAVSGDVGFSVAGIRATNTGTPHFEIFDNDTGSALSGTAVTNNDVLSFKISVQIAGWNETQTIAEQLGL